MGDVTLEEDVVSAPPQTTDAALAEQGTGLAVAQPPQPIMQQAQYRVPNRLTPAKLRHYFNDGPQYGPLPQDPSDFLSTDRAMSAFTQYLERHHIFAPTDLSASGPQNDSIFFNLRHEFEDWLKKFRQLKGGTGDPRELQIIAERIRRAVQSNNDVVGHERQASARIKASQKYVADELTDLRKNPLRMGPGKRPLALSATQFAKAQRGPARKAKSKPKVGKNWEYVRDQALREYSKLLDPSHSAHAFMQDHSAYTSKFAPKLGSTGERVHTALDEKQLNSHFVTSRGNQYSGAGPVSSAVGNLHQTIRNRRRFALDVHKIHYPHIKSAHENHRKHIKKFDDSLLSSNPDAHGTVMDVSKQYAKATARNYPYADRIKAFKDMIELREKHGYTRYMPTEKELASYQAVKPAGVKGFSHQDLYKETQKLILGQQRFDDHFKSGKPTDPRVYGKYKEEVQLLTDVPTGTEQWASAERGRKGTPAQYSHTLRTLEARDDHRRWRTLRDALQRYDKLIMPGAPTSFLVAPQTPLAASGQMLAAGKGWDVKPFVGKYGRKISRGKTLRRMMVHPVWDTASEKYVHKVSTVPFKSEKYPSQSATEGGIYRDFISSGDLDQVIKDLDIKVPPAKLAGKYEEMALGDPRNLLYAPFVKAVREKRQGDKSTKKIATAYETMKSSDMRKYQALLTRLQHYTKMGIDHKRLNDAADFYRMRPSLSNRGSTSKEINTTP